MNSSPRAEFVVDPTSEDELPVEATGLGSLRIEELKLPIDNGRICYKSVSS